MLQIISLILHNVWQCKNKHPHEQQQKSRAGLCLEPPFGVVRCVQSKLQLAGPSSIGSRNRHPALEIHRHTQAVRGWHSEIDDL